MGLFKLSNNESNNAPRFHTTERVCVTLIAKSQQRFTASLYLGFDCCCFFYCQLGLESRSHEILSKGVSALSCRLLLLFNVGQWRKGTRTPEEKLREYEGLKSETKRGMIRSVAARS